MRAAPERGASPARRVSNLARLPGARRVWATAAVNGEAGRLARLHDLIGERLREGDRLVYLGNYLGAGQVLATIDELLDFRRRFLARPSGFACDVVFLRGAQEEMWHKLLQLQFAPNPGDVLRWVVSAGMDAAVRAYGGDLQQGFAASRGGAVAITRWTAALRDRMNDTPGHRAFFSSLRHAASTGPGGLLFVHAAVDPAQPLAGQGDAFWWGHHDILLLDTPFEEFRRVVRGTDRDRRGVVERRFAASVDGGAGRGGPLIAACFGRDGAVLETVEA
jgi:serine/threonine protein phosphatase 1